MTYRSYRPDRRHRRRRWALIALTLIAAIAAIAYLVSRETEHRGAVEFLAAADEATSLHAANSVELESALGAIGVVARQDLLARLDRIAQTAQEADALLDIDVPSVVASQYGSLRTASAAWVEGISEVQAALVLLMDGGATEVAVPGLGTGFDRLRAGDSAYDLFQQSVSEPVDDIEFPSFPLITYVNPEPQDVLVYNPTEIVLSVLGSYQLAAHHNVGVTGQIEPSPVAERSGIPVVPFSEGIAVTAVVSNTGNEVETVVTVQLEILNADTGESATLTQTIDNLAGGASSSVTFRDLQVEPGSLYQVKLTVTIVEDSRPEDDTWDLRFIRNEES